MNYKDAYIYPPPSIDKRYMFNIQNIWLQVDEEELLDAKIGGYVIPRKPFKTITIQERRKFLL